MSDVTRRLGLQGGWGYKVSEVTRFVTYLDVAVGKFSGICRGLIDHVG